MHSFVVAVDAADAACSRPRDDLRNDDQRHQVKLGESRD